MQILTNTSWQELIDDYNGSQSIEKITKFIKDEISLGKKIYPNSKLIFNSLNIIDFSNVAVVILGQDPYHGENQANGLAFSVNKGVNIPPSLRNIFKEIESDTKKPVTNTGDLSSWAKSGVLLLNTVLTVEENKANSHKDVGWQEFTDHIIIELSKKRQHLVFLLWGANAHKKVKLIDSKHTILCAPHPSPLSSYRGFFGCKHFTKANDALSKNNQQTIDWNN